MQALLALIVEGTYSSEYIKDLLRPTTESLTVLSSVQPSTTSATGSVTDDSRRRLQDSGETISAHTQTISLQSLAGSTLVFRWEGGDNGDLYVTVEGTDQVRLLLACTGVRVFAFQIILVMTCPAFVPFCKTHMKFRTHRSPCACVSWCFVSPNLS